MVDITQERAAAIAALATLAEQAGLTDVREEGWVDAYDMMEALGVTRGAAMSMMNKLVERGLADTKMVIDRDRRARVRVWRMVEQP